MVAVFGGFYSNLIKRVCSYHVPTFLLQPADVVFESDDAVITVEVILSLRNLLLWLSVYYYRNLNTYILVSSPIWSPSFVYNFIHLIQLK